MSFINIRFVKIIIASIVLSVNGTAVLGEDNCILSIRPVQDQYVLGEPVRLILSIRNQGDQIKKIRLGMHGVDELILTVEKDGVPIHVPEYVPAGFHQSVYLTINPNETADQVIYLDEMFVPSECGEYTVTIRLRKENISQADTKVLIVPYDDVNLKRLRDMYVSTWEEMKKHDFITPEQDELRKLIILSQNPAAIDVQILMIEERKWDYEECQKIVGALIKQKEKKGIQAIVQYILGNAGANPFERSIVLDELRKANAKEWDEDIYRIIKPYINEIESSVPIGVSD